MIFSVSKSNCGIIWVLYIEITDSIYLVLTLNETERYKALKVQSCGQDYPVLPKTGLNVQSLSSTGCEKNWIW